VKALQLGAALVAVLAIQTTLAYTVMGNRAVMDLVLVLVMFVAIRHGAVAGLLFGSIAGLCQDALSGGIIGVGGLAKSLVGVGTGALATQFIVTNTLPRFVVLFLGTMVHAACFLGIYELIQPRGIGRPWGVVLAQATVTAVAGLLMFAFVERVPEKMHKRRMRRTHLRTRVQA
jgi:rod shape-determining protein MreD